MTTLITSPTEAETTDPDKYPAPEWLRSITMLDPCVEDGEQVPVHVGARMLVDGIPLHQIETSMRVAREPVTVECSPIDGTVVSFVVAADDCLPPNYDAEPGDDRTTKIGPFKVLTPAGSDEARRWRTEFVDEEGGEWLRVYVFVSEVSFVKQRREQS